MQFTPPHQQTSTQVNHLSVPGHHKFPNSHDRASPHDSSHVTTNDSCFIIQKQPSYMVLNHCSRVSAQVSNRCCPTLHHYPNSSIAKPLFVTKALLGPILAAFGPQLRTILKQRESD